MLHYNYTIDKTNLTNVISRLTRTFKSVNLPSTMNRLLDIPSGAKCLVGRVQTRKSDMVLFFIIAAMQVKIGGKIQNDKMSLEVRGYGTNLDFDLDALVKKSLEGLV